MSGSRTPTSLMLRLSSSSFAASKCLRGFVGDSPSFPSGINWNDVLLLWTELALDILLSPFFSFELGRYGSDLRALRESGRGGRSSVARYCATHKKTPAHDCAR